MTASVGNGRSEICWAVVTPDVGYAFTTNFADGAVSRYSIAEDGRLTLDAAAAAFSVDGRTGLRDEGLSSDGRYLYAIDADAGSVFGWRASESSGDEGTSRSISRDRPRAGRSARSSSVSSFGPGSFVMLSEWSRTPAPDLFAPRCKSGR